MFSTQSSNRIRSIHYIARREVYSVPVPEKEFWSHLTEAPSPERDTTISVAGSTRKLCHIDRFKIDIQLQKLRNTKIEEDSYVPIAIILNVLSMAQIRHLYSGVFSEDGNFNATEQERSPKTIVYLLNHSQSLFGDIFNTKIQPDIVAVPFDYTFAQKYLQQLESPQTHKLPRLGDIRSALATLVGVGEFKRPHRSSYENYGNPARLSNYLDDVKRYRPDLDRVYGIYSCRAGFAVYQLNPCQMTLLSCEFMNSTTRLIPWNHENTLSILQKSISAIYSLSASSHSLSLEANTLQVWKFDPRSLISSQEGKEPKKVFRMAPFYAAHAPGRMTWVSASFEEGNRSIHRISKLYWVDEDARWSEEQLYERAHGRSEGKHCWLGGLARVDDYWDLDRRLQAVLPNNDKNSPPLRRKLVGLCLGSSGKPLNQLKTDVDVLKCIYDLLETLQQMNKNGVLHRDISYGNVFCHPEHLIDPGDNGTITGCIGEILKEENPRFRVLLTDLDQGAGTPTSSAAGSKVPNTRQEPDPNEEGAGRWHRTGTPMFAAAAIADPEWQYSSSILGRLLDLIDHHKLMSPRLQGLAQEDYNFYANLLKKAYENQTAYAYTIRTRNSSESTPPEHRPCHDAESVSWLTSFLLVRALPFGETNGDPDNKTDDAYNRFCTAMLSHVIGEPGQPRAQWGQNIDVNMTLWNRTLHPKLRHRAGLLNFMALYLSIDWSAVSPDIPDNHAYRIFKLFLLDEILKNKESVKLQTKFPRAAYDIRGIREGTSRTYATSVESRTSITNEVVNSHGKRQNQEDKLESQPPSKMAKLEHSSGVTAGFSLHEAKSDADEDVEGLWTELTQEEKAEDDKVATSRNEVEFFAEWEKARKIQSERLVAHRWYYFRYIEPKSRKQPQPS